MTSPFRTEGESVGHSVAHLHVVGEIEHVRALVAGQRLFPLAQNVSHLFESEPQLVRVDELSDQGDILPGQPVIQSNEESVQTPGDLLVVGTVHLDRLPEVS